MFGPCTACVMLASCDCGGYVVGWCLYSFSSVSVCAPEGVIDESFQRNVFYDGSLFLPLCRIAWCQFCSYCLVSCSQTASKRSGYARLLIVALCV